MNMDEALADGNPLIRHQAQRELYYAAEGFGPDDGRRIEDKQFLNLLDLWARNRAVVAKQRAGYRFPTATRSPTVQRPAVARTTVPTWGWAPFTLIGMR